MWGGYRTAAVRLSRFGPVMCDWIPPRLLLYYDFNRPSDEHSGSIKHWHRSLGSLYMRARSLCQRFCQIR